MKIGILGGGQLARMLALAAYPLGIKTVCLDPVAQVSASYVTEVYTGDYLDKAMLKKFVEHVDVITFETENIPKEIVAFLQQSKPIYPSINALETAQDRLHEKKLFAQLNIATPQYFAINSLQELEQAVATMGLPAVLKTRRFGYDGKGQYVIRDASDMQAAWQMLQSHPLILEKFIKFECELSIIAVRSLSGELRFYPLTENQHREGILRISKAPFHDPILQQLAETYAKKIVETLNYVGVLAIEFFCCGQQLIANEMAPRVHNSGHWTIEGASTSQFENHVRAICGLPLGSTEAVGLSAMINCIGNEPILADILRISTAHYHTYDKTPKPQRKIGHVTVVEKNQDNYQQNIQKILEIISE